jgi:hypothetical protein
MRAMVKGDASSRGRSQSSREMGLVGSLVFALAGLFVAYGLVKGMVHDLRVAHTYVETSCTVTASHAASGKNAPAAYIDVTYEVDGRSRNASGVRVGLPSRAKELGVGTKSSCYYDPDAPSSVVVDRAQGSPIVGLLLGLLVPGIFVAIGLGGLVQSLRHFGKSPEAILAEQAMEHARVNPHEHAASAKANASPYRAARAGPTPQDPDDLSGLPLPKVVTLKGEKLPVRLARGQPRVVELGLLGGVATFWNAIVLMFLVVAVQSSRAGLVLFLVPFVIVGVVLLWMLVRRVLLFAVREPIVELTEHPIRHGRPALLSITQRGPIHAEVLRVVLRGVEEASYRSGKSSHTDKKTFFELELVTEEAMGLERGQSWTKDVEMVVPPDQPASFASANNALRWEVVVKTVLRNFPDDENAFPVLVLPTGENADE